MVSHEKENLLRGFSFLFEEEQKVLLRLNPSIYIISKENKGISRPEKTTKDLFRGLKVSMCIAHKNSLSLRGKPDQATVTRQ
jgi:hypothetical protein